MKDFTWIPLVDAWWMKHLQIREDKVVVKIYDHDNNFKAAVNIPTVMWPLSDDPQVFHWNKTKGVTDSKVSEIVDAIPYHLGHCYTNAETITKALCDAGYNAKYFAGWMFVSGSEYPLHHAWTVLDGNQVIDLADDVALQHLNADKFENAKTIHEARALMVEFHKWAQTLPHSDRCMPFGIPSPTVLYVGCESNRKAAIDAYNSLIEKFPDHPCQRPTTKSGGTILQEMFMQSKA